MPEPSLIPTKSETYKNAVGDWLSCAAREPDSLVTGSLLFLLCCLPVVTFGPAWLALTYYMGRRSAGIKTSWRGAVSFSLRRCGIKAWLMGWSDFLALALAGGGLLALWGMGLPAAMRFFYGIALILDALYLISGLYRYPALAKEPGNRLSRIIVRGFLLTIGNLSWTLLFACIQLLLLMLCAVTGIGLIFLYPGALSLLCYYAYNEVIRLYFPNK